MTELQMISKLSDAEQPPTTLTSIHVKTPRRILHFSDGTIEEYSTDDETDGANKNSDESAPTTMLGHIMVGGTKVLAACDYVGEKIASALGITSPKYNYEIEQFKKIQKENEKATIEEKTTGGWMQDTLEAQCKLAEKEISNGPVVSQQGLQKY